MSPSTAFSDPAAAANPATRAYWVSVLKRIATPVLTALAEGRLRATMPVEVHSQAIDRAEYTHLEAIARTLVGIAPWLELPADDTPEGRDRATYAHLARASLRSGLHPESPNRLNFERGTQPIVDAGFLAQAVLRAPNALFAALEERDRTHLADALRRTRNRKPGFSNWLLFSATIEAALCRMGAGDWDPMRVDYALRQHDQWHLGDGAYSDGPQWHWDYYNSFVIQPMLVDVLNAVGDTYAEWAGMRNRVLGRAQRWAAVQERFISPEGTFPPIGRSLAYRFGALQGLAQTAMLHTLPPGVSPASVRCALTAVIRRMIEAPGTFDENGWLRIGFCGAQPAIGEPYISTGSLYLCCAALLPLGLSPDDPFWSNPDEPWTAQRAWYGFDLPPDQAIKG